MRLDRLPERHCSDEALIAHLDGELSSRASRAIATHLQACWSCRARLDELEQQAHVVARLLCDPSYPGPSRIEAAKARFLGWKFNFEQTLMPASEISLLRLSPSMMVLVAGLVLVCVAVGVGLGLCVLPATADEVLLAAEKFEDQIAAAPLQQSLDVEFLETRPEPVRRRGRLEVWADSRSSRFASRWEDDRGTLRYAMWKPTAGREYVYDPTRADGVVPRDEEPSRAASLLEFSRQSWTEGELEAGFLRWLQNRRWNPVSLTRNLRVLNDEEGVTVGVEPAIAEGGRRVLRLTARRVLESTSISITVEVDAKSFQPRLQVMIFESPGRHVELRLVAGQLAVVPPGRLLPAVFEPDLPFAARALPMPPALKVSPSSAFPVLPEPQLALGPSPADLDAAEIQARYVLHRLGVCLGESIEVLREEKGLIRVIGLAHSPARAQQIFRELSQLELASLVAVEIQTVAEAVSSLPNGQAEAEYRGRSYSIQTTPYVAPRFSIQDQLASYFKELHSADLDSASAGARALRFSNQLVALSSDLRREGWALRHLVDRYSADETEMLRPPSRWIFEIMVNDHILHLEKKILDFRDLAVPVLQSLAGAMNPLSGQQTDPLPERPPQGATGAEKTWRDSYTSLFAEIKTTHGLVHALFAGQDQQGLEASQPTSTAELLHQLLAALPSLQEKVRHVYTAAPADFEYFDKTRLLQENSLLPPESPNQHRP